MCCPARSERVGASQATRDQAGSSPHATGERADTRDAAGTHTRRARRAGFRTREDTELYSKHQNTLREPQQHTASTPQVQRTTRTYRKYPQTPYANPPCTLRHPLNTVDIPLSPQPNRGHTETPCRHPPNTLRKSPNKLQIRPNTARIEPQHAGGTIQMCCMQHAVSALKSVACTLRTNVGNLPTQYDYLLNNCRQSQTCCRHTPNVPWVPLLRTFSRTRIKYPLKTLHAPAHIGHPPPPNRCK